jgi:FkbM family methyltransferase
MDEMIASLARFANDSFSLWRTPHSTRKKIALWFNLLHPSGKMLGFDVAHFDGPTLSHLYREIFARQHYYFKSKTDSPVILDCGGNIGMATMYFKWLYPKSRIEVFEPDPSTFAVLESNVTGNRLTDVKTHNCALWDENREIDFFRDEAEPGSLLMSASASRLKGEIIRIPGRKLSEFIQGPIDFLKLDVEGAENRILADLVSTGKIRFVLQMVIEYHHRIENQRSCLADFLGLIEEAGFEYQLHSSLWPVTAKNVFQDMLIGAYRD